MKIYTKVVIDMSSGDVIEEESFDYVGPVASCDPGDIVEDVGDFFSKDVSKMKPVDWFGPRGSLGEAFFGENKGGMFSPQARGIEGFVGNAIPGVVLGSAFGPAGLLAPALGGAASGLLGPELENLLGVGSSSKNLEGMPAQPKASDTPDAWNRYNQRLYNWQLEQQGYRVDRTDYSGQINRVKKQLANAKSPRKGLTGGSSPQEIAALENELAKLQEKQSNRGKVVEIPYEELNEDQRLARDINSAQKKMTLAAITGNLPVSQALERDIKEQRQQTLLGLQRGAGAESTSGIQTLAKQQEGSNIAREQVRFGRLSSLQAQNLLQQQQLANQQSQYLGNVLQGRAAGASLGLQQQDLANQWTLGQLALKYGQQNAQTAGQYQLAGQAIGPLLKYGLPLLA